jgi:hypothetical protein
MKKEEFSDKREEFRNKSVEELLNLLGSKKLPTRFFAEMALRDLSGT